MIKVDGKTKTKSVSKFDVINEQLSDAIYLLINDGYEISIHTLIMASYQILYDLLPKDHFLKKDSIFNSKSIMFKEEYKKEAMHHVRKAMNFFKHADREDNTDSIEFYHESNESLLLLSLITYQVMNPKEFNLRKDLVSYLNYLIVKYPQFFEEQYTKKIPKINKNQIRVIFNAFRSSLK